MDRARCLTVFVKYPEKGRVKTRLSPALGEDTAVSLCRAFIHDLLDNLSQGDYSFRIACHPEERISDLLREFGSGFSCVPQAGADLGERMLEAFKRCFDDGFMSVAVMGSDIPGLPKRIIEDAFRALKDNGAVIGPTFDGGYYLIGFRRESFVPAAFRGMKWGGDSVFAETAHALERAGVSFHVLEQWRDIDRPEDIAALVNDSGKPGFSASRTMACLRSRGLAKVD
jgi:rSAM/selenodomain-associated transferase 1